MYVMTLHFLANDFRVYHQGWMVQFVVGPE